MDMRIIPAEERFKMIGSVYFFFIREGKILLLRRFQTGYRDGEYSVPAGHTEEGETLTQAISREVREETGLDIPSSMFQLIHVMHRFETDIRMDNFFVAEQVTGEPTNTEPQKCDDLSWFPLNALPQNMVPCIRAAIDNYQKHIWYSEFGWEAYGR